MNRMLFLSRRLLVWCCFLIGFFLNGQDFQIEEVLTTKDGLPSNETYASFFDEKGDLWMLTDKGLAKYNGIEFTYLRKKDGLLDNSFFKCFRDYKGRVWLTSAKGVCYLEGDSVFVPSFNENMARHPYFDIVNSLFVDSLDQVYIALERGICGYFSCSLSSEKVTFHKLTENCVPFLSPNASLGSQLSLYLLKRNSKDVLSAAINTSLSEPVPTADSLTYPIPSIIHTMGSYAKVAQVYNAKQRLVFLGLDKTVYGVTETGDSAFPLGTYEKDIIYMTMKGPYLYICLRGGGVIQRHIASNHEKHMLGNMSVAHINFSSAHTLWCATLDNGLIKVNILLNKAFSLPDDVRLDVITAPIFFDGSTLRFLRQEKVETFRVNKNELAFDKAYTLPILTQTVYGEVRWISGETVWVQSGQINYVKGEITAMIPVDRVLGKTKASNFSDRLFCFGFGGFAIYSGQLEELFSSRAQGFSERVSVLLEIDSDSILLGTFGGLYKLVDSSISPVHIPNLSHQDRIDHLTLFRDRILIGTSGKGLIVTDGDSSIVFNRSNGLSGDFVQKIMVRGDTAWVGTNEGLNILYNQRERGSDRWILSPVLTKIPVDDIFDTPKGLYLQSMLDFYTLDVLNVTPTNKPKLLLSYLTAEGKEKDASWGSEVSLARGKHVLKVGYRLNTLLDKQTQSYSYRVLGLSDVWQETNALEITMGQLPFGHYTLEIRGKGADGTWSNTESLSFQLVPLLYETAWFQALMFLCLGLLLGGGLWFGQKQYSKSLRRENLLLQTSMNSLKLQINPHFIFNALNSLQYLIVSNQKKKSTHFLASLSELIRSVLESSLEKNSSLERELKRIESYIDLEELRFETAQIQFEVKTSLAHDLSQVYIPNMLLQPLVENAIWHGFKGSKRAPALTISIEEVEQESLLLQVIDNGVGIDLDVMKKRQGDGSLAIRNIEERLFLLSRLYKKKYSIEFSQLQEGGECLGTKVSLTLPLQFKA